jgi:thiosulfate/3-mercaptopyruvate sulfurtransferase
MIGPIISATELEALFDSGCSLHVFDCRFDLAQPEAGFQAWQQGHIPGAHYVHLDHHLSAAKTGKNGRHPLPSPEAWKLQREQWGLAADTPIVCYDDQGGIFAARLWWMLKSTGHTHVQVLDGGFGAWLRQQGAVSTDTPSSPPPSSLAANPFAGLVEKEEVYKNIQNQLFTLVDARAADRFAGLNETLDPVGGHIPGAQNRFFKENLGGDGLFKSPAELKTAFLALPNPKAVVHQCGSGVTACHNLLAMEVAKLGGSRLYAGSWSEWCCQEGYPVSTG